MQTASKQSWHRPPTPLITVRIFYCYPTTFTLRAEFGCYSGLANDFLMLANIRAILRVISLELSRRIANNDSGGTMATATHARILSKRKSRGASRDDNELRTLRHRYALSQALLSRLLDVSLRTISGAESSPTVPAQMRRSLTQ